MALSGSREERLPLLDTREVEQQQDGTTKREKSAILALLFLFSTGANWSEACLGPLKSDLIEQFSISNAQFGVISASTQLANTFFPILTGIWIDRVGAAKSSIYATLTVLIGSVLAAISCTSLNYPLLIIGRIIQGTGVIIVDTAATKLIIKTSRGSNWLGLAISCNFAFDRAAAAISKATAVPIAGISSGHGSTQISLTFWTAALVSTISLSAALVHNRLIMAHEDRSGSIAEVNRSSSHHGTLAVFRKSMSSLPVFFVLIAVTQFYQPIAVLNTLSADILRWRGSSPLASGYLSSIGQVMPIFIAPHMGLFFDRHGHRLDFIPLTALLLGISIALLAWTHVSTLLAMIIFSLANALNTPPYLTSLAILFRDESTFGCAWGIWKTLMQSNQIIMNTTLGKLQDATPQMGYQYVLFVLFASKVLEFIWGLSYVAFDHFYAHGILSSNEKSRKSIESNEARPSRGLQSSSKSTFILYVYLVTVILSAWCLFFTSVM